MVASSYSRIGSGPRHASANKRAKDTPQTLALLQHFSHSRMQNKVGWIDLQARNFGYSELLKRVTEKVDVG